MEAKGFLADIEKKYGSGAVMRLGDKADMKVETISTGSMGLDIALGAGGYPMGRIVEIFGPESSGKTTLTLHAIAEFQKAGGTALFIDAEHALDPIYAEAVGVDTENLLVSQPSSGEQALQIAEDAVQSGEVGLVVVDSVSSLTPKAEIEGEIGDSHIGLLARLMSQAMRKLTAQIQRTHATVIFINQIRMKIGVVFGNPETTSGGNALKFHASVRLDVRGTKKVNDQGDDGAEGKETTVKVIKNKVGAPFKKAKFNIIFKEGISKEMELIDIGSSLDGVDTETGEVIPPVVTKKGAFYYLGDERLGQGKDKATLHLKENPDVASVIEAGIRERAGL